MAFEWKVLLRAASVGLMTFGCAMGQGSIGAKLVKNNDTGRVQVREVPADMYAWHAGLRPDDELLRIDGRDVRTMTPEQIHEALVGPIGSSVHLTVMRDGAVIEVTVRRGPLKD